MSDYFKTLREKEEEKRKEQLALLANTKYHLLQVTELRYGVIYSMSWVSEHLGNPPYRHFRFVEGLEKVKYHTAQCAVNDLNAGRTTEGSYDHE